MMHTAMVTSLQLPHWLIIAGALLVVAGFIGWLFDRRKADAAPDEPTEAPKAQMPLLPTKTKKVPKSAISPPA